VPCILELIVATALGCLNALLSVFSVSISHSPGLARLASGPFSFAVQVFLDYT
jgi:hypothetical protein